MLWIYFGMMMTAFMCIAFAVSCGKAEAQHKKIVEKQMTKEVGSASV